MNLKSIIILLLAFSFSALANALNLKFSDEVKNTGDAEVIQIRDLWQNYVNACIENDSIKINEYWKGTDADAVRYFLGGNVSCYV